MKLKKIISENSLSPEQKATFIEAVSNFNDFGKSIYRENNLSEVVENIKKLSESAGNYIMSETEDWFDGVTVKRDVKEISNAANLINIWLIEERKFQRQSIKKTLI